MIDDRNRKPKRSGGWTPQNLLSTAGRGAAALAMAGGIGRLAGRILGAPRADRYPQPVQGSAERRRRIRQQERLARKLTVKHANA